MRIKLLPVIIAVLLLAAMTLSAYKPFIIISNIQVFGKPARGAVSFPHERHYAVVDCLHCHHRYENGRNTLTWDELKPGSKSVSCRSCHTSARELENAYHKMCIRCHGEMKRMYNLSGPVMCGHCHNNNGGTK